MERDPIVRACREDQRTIVGNERPDGREVDRRQATQLVADRLRCRFQRRAGSQLRDRTGEHSVHPGHEGKVGLHLMDPSDIDHLARIPDRPAAGIPEWRTVDLEHQLLTVTGVAPDPNALDVFTGQRAADESIAIDEVLVG